MTLLLVAFAAAVLLAATRWVVPSRHVVDATSVAVRILRSRATGRWNAVPWLGAAAILLSASAPRAQYTWVKAGTPPPSTYFALPPFNVPHPYMPQHAFWDETRGRARVTFGAQDPAAGSLPTVFTTAEFDGATWMGAGTPPGTSGMGRAFDAVCADPRGGGRHLLFGGNHQVFISLNDTLVWDPIGRAWNTASPATVPAARFLHSMALLPGVGAVMFGGQVSLLPTFTDETWIWNGSDWRQVLTSPRPSPRTTPAMAFDTVRGELLLLGDGGAANDTWSFNGTRWLQLSPANSPGGGGLRQMVTDPIRRTVLFFGGTARPNSGPRNDTWTWDGANWNLRTPAHSPPPRVSGVTVWDSRSQRVLLLSGYSSGTSSLPDSWAWDGTDWTELPNTDRDQPVVPSPRSFPFLAHSLQKNRTIQFGGYTQQSIFDVPLADTWEGENRLWQRRTLAVNPPASFMGAGAILRSTGELYWLPGQDIFGSSYNQSWNWGGQQWSPLSLSAAPIPSLAHQVVGSLQSSQLGWVLVRLVTSGTWPALTNTLQLISPFSGVVQTMFPGGGPTPRLGSVMVQSNSPSVVNNGVWLFGGSTPALGGGSIYYDELWALTDTGTGGNLAWTLQAPASGSPLPAARQDAAAAYHPTQNRIVVAGGRTASTLGDTWSFDLSTRVWTQVSGPGPAPRYGAAMTYDASIDRVVLFGGHDGAVRFNDIWECDGMTWTQRATAGRPTPRNNHSFVYDRISRRSVVFGGHDGQSSLNDTWIHDGARWTPIVDGLASPPPRFTHSACFVEQEASMVVFGGTTDGIGELGDTWRLDQAGRWTPGAAGPARVNPAMVYAIVQGQPSCLMFGGYAQGSWLGDTWRYLPASNTWQQLAGGPDARDIHAMAWDRMRNVVVLFGGRSVSAFFADDTWEFNCATAAWSLRSPAHRPPGRWNGTMDFDQSRGRTVLFGGYNGNYLNDVWEWNGIDWEQRAAETDSPVGREDATMAYDSDRGRLAMIGGWTGSTRMDDLWYLNARIDRAGAGNTASPEGLRFYSQPALGRPLQLGFANPQGFGFHTLGFGPLQQPLGPLPVPPLCEPSSIWATFASYLVLGIAEPNIAWNVPNTPLILGYTLVFQAFALQPAGCWRATDALLVRF